MKIPSLATARAKLIAVAAIVIVLVAIIIASGSSTPPYETVVKNFYQSIGDNNYNGAFSLLCASQKSQAPSATTLQSVQQAPWQELVNKHGKFKNVSITSSAKQGPTQAIVELKINFANSPVVVQASAAHEGGKWVACGGQIVQRSGAK